eukprot:m.225517 g.225517  ORF g.225517 m.225517 type:complete len:95 (-) comp15651_c0_seq37:4410-4694(-)
MHTSKTLTLIVRVKITATTFIARAGDHNQLFFKLSLQIRAWMGKASQCAKGTPFTWETSALNNLESCLEVHDDCRRSLLLNTMLFGLVICELYN